MISLLEPQAGFRLASFLHPEFMDVMDAIVVADDMDAADGCLACIWTGGDADAEGGTGEAERLPMGVFALLVIGLTPIRARAAFVGSIFGCGGNPV